jgi:uncharacterized repeat protein (TIGR03987 family)
MGISVACIITAFVLYTLAVWSEWAVKKLKPWIAAVFVTGFMCDLAGTLGMAMLRTSPIFSRIHGIFGAVAIFIMFLHALWAMLALMKSGKAEEYFTRFSRFAWLLWMAAFLTGIPK